MILTGYFYRDFLHRTWGFILQDKRILAVASDDESGDLVFSIRESNAIHVESRDLRTLAVGIGDVNTVEVLHLLSQKGYHPTNRVWVRALWEIKGAIAKYVAGAVTAMVLAYIFIVLMMCL